VLYLPRERPQQRLHLVIPFLEGSSREVMSRAEGMVRVGVIFACALIRSKHEHALGRPHTFTHMPRQSRTPGSKYTACMHAAV